MRKPVIRRVILFTFIYCAIFIFIASLQFARQEGFSINLGNILVSGQYRFPDDNEQNPGINGQLSINSALISFGGMDFGLINGRNDRFLLITTDNEYIETEPESLLLLEDSVSLIFIGGAALQFHGRLMGDMPQMIIQGTFPEDISGIAVPFRPGRRTQIREEGGGRVHFNANGQNYSFGPSNLDFDRMMLTVGTGAVVYRAIPERRNFYPEDYIIARAGNAQSFNDELRLIRDGNFELWSRTISTANNESLAIAFIGEALDRGSYRQALSAVPGAFLSGPERSFESSVYFGDLLPSHLALIRDETALLNRLSANLNSGSIDFLNEMRIVNYLAIRGHFTLLNSIADLLRFVDPEADPLLINLDIISGILEGFADWNNIRPNTVNPFEHLIESTIEIIQESLHASAADDLVFVYRGTGSENEFNLRLGMALLGYAEIIQSDIWAGIGRSLILSAFALDTDPARLASLHRMLSPTNTLPRPVQVSASPDHVWALTTAPSISSTYQNDTLHIAVNFPVGETHYMIIRGIRPFSRIQLYNIDFRTDPRFESFESSGWSYSAAEQTLLVKMQHRSQLENIRIIYREPPRPVVVPVISETDDDEEDSIDD
ncbi:MAG: hypothetical protein FWG77_11235 [Treponema sp.]|nr:hypothetical protein [Treponema sp.]